MSIRELESLVAIADRGSITAAADILFLSVPAVSAHVASMEERLRTKLLDRRRKPASLNAAGLLLSEQAREVLRVYRDFYATIAENADLAGTLRLGAAVSMLTGVIPQALARLRATHPRLQIRMHHGVPRSLLKNVQRGEIDALVCSEPPALPKGTRWIAFAKEPMMVIAPLGTSERTDETLLKEHPYIRYGTNFWTSQVVEAHLARRGIVPNQIMVVDFREAIALMVHHGLGVSIVPVGDPPLSRLYGLREVPLGRPPMMRHIGLAFSEDSARRPLIDTLLRVLVLSVEKTALLAPAGSKTIAS